MNPAQPGEPARSSLGDPVEQRLAAPPDGLLDGLLDETLDVPVPEPAATRPGTGQDQAERFARAGLAATVEPGHLRIARSVQGNGAAATWEQLRRGSRALDPTGRWSRRAADVDPAAVLAATRQRGLRMLVPGDPQWPAALASMSATLELAEPVPPPIALWVRGEGDVAALTAEALAVVGARAATEYGLRVAADLAADLALAGVVVASGGAYGVDQAAHRGALAVGVPTVAVLACGADLAYPRAHAQLLTRVAETGVVLSELPPGSTPTRSRFLSRNRVIAGLCRGVLVVEAARRSGALSTAGWAERLGRPVAAVPGPVTSAQSVGCHDLVRDGRAVLVTDVAEVLDALGEYGTHGSDRPTSPDTELDRMLRTVRDVYEAVPGSGTTGIEQLSHRTGLEPAQVADVLQELETSGLVRPDGGGWRLR